MSNEQENLVVVGISAASPFAQVLSSTSRGKFIVDKWSDVECLADIMMDNVEWAEQPTDGLFNRPYLLMHGQVESIYPIPGREFLGGVQRVEFPLGLGSVEDSSVVEEGEDIDFAIVDNDEFEFDSTMVPESDYCFGFTFNELAFLATQGAVLGVPEIPEQVSHNRYVGMPATCDITRLTDRDTKDEFWVIDIPSAEAKKKYGYSIDVDSLSTGYQMVSEIIPEDSPIKKQMLQYGDYMAIPGMQEAQVFTPDVSEELDTGDFDLSNALFQDNPVADVEPLVGKDLEERVIEPMQVDEKSSLENNADIEYVDDLVDRAMDAHGIHNESVQNEIEQTTEDMLSEDDKDFSLEDLFGENQDKDIDSIDFGDTDITAEEDAWLFGDEDEAQDILDDKKRQEAVRKNQQKRITEEQQARERVSQLDLTPEQESQDEIDLSEQLFG